MIELENSPVKEDLKLHVLLIGNNPIDLSTVETYLKKLSSKGVITEIAFDLRTLIQRLLIFKPGFILIDDNVGGAELKSLVNTLSQNKNTNDIPIGVIKNSNYAESFSNGVSEYLLKSTLSEDSLYKSFINILRLRKTRKYLYLKYKKKKLEFMRLLDN